MRGVCASQISQSPICKKLRGSRKHGLLTDTLGISLCGHLEVTSLPVQPLASLSNVPPKCPTFALVMLQESLLDMSCSNLPFVCSQKMKQDRNRDPEREAWDPSDSKQLPLIQHLLQAREPTPNKIRPLFVWEASGFRSGWKSSLGAQRGESAG